jgi:hypothetical protein
VSGRLMANFDASSNAYDIQPMALSRLVMLLMFSLMVVNPSPTQRVDIVARAEQRGFVVVGNGRSLTAWKEGRREGIEIVAHFFQGGG